MPITHSDKALTTLATMATTPDQWALTEILWVEEERLVMGQVTCPTCLGCKWVRYENGQAVPQVASTFVGHGGGPSFDDVNAARSTARQNPGYSLYGNCPTCKAPLRTKLGRVGGCTGKVPGLVLKAIMVGYPQFPAGARFDSRFAGSCCHLCAKRIEKSGRVPVNTITTDGAQHAMWVGEDCARKFLNVKIKRADDSVMEDGASA